MRFDNIPLPLSHIATCASVLPVVPMQDCIQWLAWCWIEICADGVSHWNESCLRDFIVRNPKNAGYFLFIDKVKGGPDCSQAASASREHETPRGRENRTPCAR